MTLRAHHNVISLADWRRTRGADKAVRFQMCVPPGCFVDWRAEPSPPSHPAAQALLAGVMQGIGQREKDEAMVDAGRRLAQAAKRGLPEPCPHQTRPWWRRWWL